MRFFLWKKPDILIFLIAILTIHDKLAETVERDHLLFVECLPDQFLDIFLLLLLLMYGHKAPNCFKHCMLHDLLYFLALGVGQTSTHASSANDACTGRHSFKVLLKKLWKCSCLWISDTVNLICLEHPRKFDLNVKIKLKNASWDWIVNMCF